MADSFSRSASRWPKQHRHAEQTIHRAARKFLQPQAARVAAKMNCVERVFRPEWLANALGPSLKQLMTAGAATRLARAGVSSDGILLPEPVRLAIEKEWRGYIYAGHWQEYQASMLIHLRQLTDTAGAAEVCRGMDEFAVKLADAIAVTEATAVLNAGGDAAARFLWEQGKIAGVVWCAGDDRHRELDGRADSNGCFRVGHGSGRFPADWRLPAAEREKCRCTMELLVAGQ